MAKKKEINEEISNEEKLNLLRKDLEKKFGKGALIGGENFKTEVDVIPTGSLGLDLALGIGGLPKGRIIEIVAEESCGKTTQAIHVIAELHKSNSQAMAAFIDAEHAFDRNYAKNLGVDLNRLEISQPSSGEEALNIVEYLLDSNLFTVIVVDSVAALVPQSEIDGDIGDPSMGKHARLMSQAMRVLTSKASKANTLLIFINQFRSKIGVMFGDSRTPTGGNALKFYASIRIEMSRSTTNTNSILEGETKLGNLIKLKVIKNKLAPPFRTAEYYIMYGTGINRIKEIIDLADSMEIISIRGNTISYMEDKYTLEDFETLLKDNEEFFMELKNKIINGYNK